MKINKLFMLLAFCSIGLAAEAMYRSKGECEKQCPIACKYYEPQLPQKPQSIEDMKPLIGTTPPHYFCGSN